MIINYRNLITNGSWETINYAILENVDEEVSRDGTKKAVFLF